VGDNDGTRMKRYSLLLAEYAKKGRSGLGIEAQRETLRHFAQAEGFEVAREFAEVAIGRKHPWARIGKMGPFSFAPYVSSAPAEDDFEGV